MSQNEFVLNKYGLNINVLKCMLSSSCHMQKMNEDQNCRKMHGGTVEWMGWEEGKIWKVLLEWSWWTRELREL